MITDLFLHLSSKNTLSSSTSSKVPWSPNNTISGYSTSPVLALQMARHFS